MTGQHTPPPPAWPSWPPRWFMILSCLLALALGSVGYIHELLSDAPNMNVLGASAWFFVLGMFGPGVISLLKR